jgi:hypothetical protein
VSDTSYEKLRRLMITSGIQIESLRATRQYLHRLFSIPIEEHHRCIACCMAFTGEDLLLRQCKFCDEPRFSASDDQSSDPFPDTQSYSHLRPRAVYQYMPISPRLQLLYANRNSALQMKYPEELANDMNWDGESIRDIWDGDMMKHWKAEGCYISRLGID